MESGGFFCVFLDIANGWKSRPEGGRKTENSEGGGWRGGWGGGGSGGAGGSRPARGEGVGAVDQRLGGEGRAAGEAEGEEDRRGQGRCVGIGGGGGKGPDVGVLLAGNADVEGEGGAEEDGGRDVVGTGPGAGGGAADQFAEGGGIGGRAGDAADFVDDAVEAVEAGQIWRAGGDGEMEFEAEFGFGGVVAPGAGQGERGGGVAVPASAVGYECAGCVAGHAEEGAAGGVGTGEVAGLDAVAPHEAVHDGGENGGDHGGEGHGQKQFDEGERVAPHGTRDAADQAGPAPASMTPKTPSASRVRMPTTMSRKYQIPLRSRGGAPKGEMVLKSCGAAIVSVAISASASV